MPRPIRKLTHLGTRGEAHMVDVSEKPATERIAVAEGRVIMAAKKEYMSCVAKHGAEACKLTIHASSLVTRELLLALVLLGCAALIPIALKKWRRSHAAAK